MDNFYNEDNMRIQQRDPDISTIFNRIKDGHIDLQPDFQRDLVWNLQKKQSLIDTILRDWQFPPVFLVIPKDGEYLEVLDGQQRLNAIYDFMEDGFPINGKVEPIDGSIVALDGLKYSQLPKDVQWRFGRYSLRVCELYDYRQEEPYELFFRLNQGSVLTPAEKRNTLYGPIREQVRKLVGRMDSNKLSAERIGFNNSRLAYQDVISRLLYALQNKSLEKKITDQLLVDLFRNGQGASDDLVHQAEMAIDTLSYIVDKKAKLNKPTLFTWLLFFAMEGQKKQLFYYLDDIKGKIKSGDLENRLHSFLVEIYREKSATSVNDAIPVQLRLLVVYLIGIDLGETFNSALGLKALRIHQALSNADQISEDFLINAMSDADWGCL